MVCSKVKKYGHIEKIILRIGTEVQLDPKIECEKHLRKEQAVEVDDQEEITAKNPIKHQI